MLDFSCFPNAFLHLQLPSNTHLHTYKSTSWDYTFQVLQVKWDCSNWAKNLECLWDKSSYWRCSGCGYHHLSLWGMYYSTTHTQQFTHWHQYTWRGRLRETKQIAVWNAVTETEHGNIRVKCDNEWKAPFCIEITVYL